MTWNYRIVKHKHDDDTWYAIHEVYYDDGKVDSVTFDPISVVADSEIGISDVLIMMIEAIEKDTLDYEDY